MATKSKFEHWEEFVNRLANSLNVQLDTNLDQEIDIQLYKAKEGSKYARNWLLCQFFYLIVSIHSQTSFCKINRYNRKSYRYNFRGVREEDSEELLQELVIKFDELVDDFDWSTAFNQWVKDQLEWRAIKFHLIKTKCYDRERTQLNLTHSELCQSESDDCDGDSDIINRIEDESGVWHRKVNQRQILEDRNTQAIILKYVNTRFNDKWKKIFHMFFIDGHSMSQIAAVLFRGYHSTVSCIIRDMREELMSYLSKIDEDCDCMFERKYMLCQKNEMTVDSINAFFDSLSAENTDIKSDMHSSVYVKRKPRYNNTELVISGQLRVCLGESNG